MYIPLTAHLQSAGFRYSQTVYWYPKVLRSASTLVVKLPPIANLQTVTAQLDKIKIQIILFTSPATPQL